MISVIPEIVGLTVDPQVVTVNISQTGPQGASGSFDGFTVDGGIASSTYVLSFQTINGGNAV